MHKSEKRIEPDGVAHTGNFLRNPVIRYIDHSVATSMEAADAIDVNGLFVGNHHYDLGGELMLLGETLRAFTARG